MKSIALFLLAAVVAHAAAPFEGRIQFQRAELPGKPHDLMYWVKGHRNRVEVWRERARAYFADVRQEQLTVVFEDERCYVTLPWLKVPPETPPLEKDGQTAKIHGYPVEKYFVIGEEGTTELWLAQGLGQYTGFGEGYDRRPEHIPGVDVPENPDPQPWEFALAGTGLFPLRVITRDGLGREVFRLEARSITAQSIDDRLLAPSPTYKKVDGFPKPGEVSP
jgi:hypothetical protein